MKVSLNIKGKRKAYYDVVAYQVDGDVRVSLGIFHGRIDQIMEKIGEQVGDSVEIVKSEFCGWY